MHAPSINIDIDFSNHTNSANSIQMQFSELKCVRSYNDVVVSFKTGNETHLDTNGVHGVQCGGFVHLICQQGFLFLLISASDYHYEHQPHQHEHRDQQSMSSMTSMMIK